jgi:hypothetical protein
MGAAHVIFFGDCATHSWYRDGVIFTGRLRSRVTTKRTRPDNLWPGGLVSLFVFFFFFFCDSEHEP